MFNKEKLKELMEKYDMPPAVLSYAMYNYGCQTSEQAIRTWLKGTSEPKYDKLEALAGVLKVTVNVFARK